METLSASVAEATEMVQNYGVFAPDEVQRVQERQRDDHTAQDATEPGYEPLQRSSGSLDEAEPVPHREETETPTAPVATAEERTVVCPHCRKTFAISLIGGE